MPHFLERPGNSLLAPTQYNDLAAMKHGLKLPWSGPIIGYGSQSGAQQSTRSNDATDHFQASTQIHSPLEPWVIYRSDSSPLLRLRLSMNFVGTVVAPLISPQFMSHIPRVVEHELRQPL